MPQVVRPVHQIVRLTMIHAQNVRFVIMMGFAIPVKTAMVVQMIVKVIPVRFAVTAFAKRLMVKIAFPVHRTAGESKMASRQIVIAVVPVPVKTLQPAVIPGAQMMDGSARTHPEVPHAAVTYYARELKTRIIVRSIADHLRPVETAPAIPVKTGVPALATVERLLRSNYHVLTV